MITPLSTNRCTLYFLSLVFICVIVPIPRAFALDPEEIDAIQAIYNAWSPAGWTTDFSLACSFAQPFDSGVRITCTDDHISRINLRGSFNSALLVTPTFPESFGNLTHLEELVMVDLEELAELPESFGNLDRLQYIRISNAPKLLYLPESLGDLEQLSSIDISSCGLRALPDSIGNVSTLAFIKFFSTDLTTFPSSIGNCTNMKELEMVAMNLFSSFPDSIGNWASLTRFSLDGFDALVSLPDTMTSLESIRILNLANLPNLEYLPDITGNVKSITQLRIYYVPKVSSYLSSLGDLPNLTTIILAGSPPLCPTNFNRSKYSSLSCSINMQQGRTSGCDCSSQWEGCIADSGYFVGGPCEVQSPGAGGGSSCPPPRPSPLFSCQNGIWVANSSVALSTIQVGGPVKINGNLTIDQQITFEGLDSIINVNGCISINETSVVVKLSDSDLKSLSNSRRKTLIESSSSSQACRDIGQINLSLTQPKSCKKVKISRTTEASSNNASIAPFSVLFDVNSSKCNIWWIVLVSVVGGVLLITAVLLVLFVCIPSWKAKARPYG